MGPSGAPPNKGNLKMFKFLSATDKELLITNNSYDNVLAETYVFTTGYSYKSGNPYNSRISLPAEMFATNSTAAAIKVPIQTFFNFKILGWDVETEVIIVAMRYAIAKNKFEENLVSTKFKDSYRESLDEHIKDLKVKTFKIFSPSEENKYVSLGVEWITYKFSPMGWFNVLDQIGESWANWRALESFAQNFVLANGNLMENNPYKKKVIEGAFMHKNKDLSGKEVEILNKKIVVDKKGVEFVLCKFSEDVGGSSLDGTSKKRDHLFIPTKLLKSKVMESKKKEGSLSTTENNINEQPKVSAAPVKYMSVKSTY